VLKKLLVLVKSETLAGFGKSQAWITMNSELHSKNHVADFTSAKTYSPRLSKSTKSKILLILVIDCLIFKKWNSRERLVAVWCFYAEKCSERSRVRISGGPKKYFSDKIHQRRKINDQGCGIKAKRHTPMEYDDLHWFYVPKTWNLRHGFLSVKTLPMLRPIKRALICSIWTAETQLILEKT
jgi:hypothetical protein